MKINSLKIIGLFKRFNHDLKFRSDERIMIMTGPNGSGKTMTLRIIDMLFNQPLLRLASMPFREVLVSFDDGSNLVVARVVREEGQEERIPSELMLTFQSISGGTKTFRVKAQIDPKELRFPVEAIEDIIPGLTQIGPRKWRDLRTGNVLALEDVVTLFGDELPQNVGDLSPTSPEWLQDIRKSIAVHFIDTERLTRPLPRHMFRYGPRVAREYSEGYPKRTVRLYSEELSEHVQKILAKYGSLSQSLDRTFPVRLVEEHEGSDSSMEALRQKLSEIEKKRSELVEAGILAQEPEGLEGLASSALDDVDESRRGVLAVYAQDAKEKLSVFDDLYQRVDAFRRIANSRFRHKQVMVRPDGLSVVNSDGSRLDLEMLSSGEQHELVILYELLFRIPADSLILIDEPELSLHVLWQEQFLEDLESMAILSNFRAILATHSPEIIGDRWDLTVELQGPNGG